MFMNSEWHSDMLRNQPMEAIRRKRQVLLSSGLCLHHDNTRTHTSRHTLKEIQDLSYSVRHIHQIWHLEIFIFLASKRRSMRKWISLQIPRGSEGGGSFLVGTAIKNFVSRGIYALVDRRRRRVERGGDYSQD